MRSMVLGVALLTFSSAAVAQSMNAQTFYKRATALKKKGPLAIFSGGEIKALMNEGQASGKAAGAAYDADKKAGRPTRFCPPPGKRQMGSDEYMQRLAAIPAAERARIDMTEATTRILIAKYPCRK
ncbi:hypothetical protein [Sphingomonas flavescens]|jgi:hypothetical protein|uniref:hypothetical protein n=1 Tax=Sphingomonas flavescens TaxID=3132797 RepID=UPI0028038BE6|nr:hypothetical protein [Sphingomonas limnosediminicola]